MQYQFTAELWAYDGPAAWVFATLPPALSAEIRALYSGLSTGFGAIGVQAAVGDTRWTTSIFYDSQRERYLLPLKKQVRRAAGLQVGASASFALTILS